jgi:aspartate/methionine/tyrosine aminotransferase
MGEPDFDTPDNIKRAAIMALEKGMTKYAPTPGDKPAREAIARKLTEENGVPTSFEQVTVTAGAKHAIYMALQAIVEPGRGDEVLLPTPAWVSYKSLIELAGAKCVEVPGSVSNGFRVTPEQLAAAITPRTRVVLLNNPQNPSGAVYGPAELQLIADAIRDTPAIVVADEVWEHVIFDGRPHTSVLAIPELRARSVKIGSAGKIFCLTGWKVGFVVAAPELLKVLAKAHQYITFTTPPNLQAAVAYGLGKPAAHFDAMRGDLQARRDRLARSLGAAGLAALPTEGTYFLNVDLAPMGLRDDAAFCRRLVAEAGVAAIPVSAFYADASMRSVVRFCFAKNDATLDGAAARLAEAAPRLAR